MIVNMVIRCMFLKNGKYKFFVLKLKKNSGDNNGKFKRKI